LPENDQNAGIVARFPDIFYFAGTGYLDQPISGAGNPALPDLPHNPIPNV